MMRQSSSRNQRSKGFKTKSFLQLFILAAVCFWLLYQLKHSLDKKRAMEDRNSRMLESVDDGQLDLIKLGRKDIPQTVVKSSRNSVDTNKEDESEEAEEDEEDQEVRRAMDDLEGRGNGDDDVDEQDREVDDEQEEQEGGDEEAENGEDSSNDGEKDEQVEETELSVDQEHDDGSQEARENSYKKDDASSAVNRYQEMGSEKQRHVQLENGEENSGKKVETNDAVDTKDDSSSKGNVNSKTFGSLVVNGTAAGNNPTTTAATIEKPFSKLEPNESVALGGEAHSELQSNSSTSSASETVEKLQSNLALLVGNKTENGFANSFATSNTTVASNGTLGIASVGEQKTTIDSGNEADNRAHLKNIVEEQTDNSNRTIGKDKLEEHSSISLASDGGEQMTQTESDSSSDRLVIEDEKETSIDLSTLPDIQTEIKNFDEESTLNEI